MNVQQSRKIKSATSEMMKTKIRINEKLMKNFENERIFGQRIQVESAERNNNVVIAEK